MSDWLAQTVTDLWLVDRYHQHMHELLEMDLSPLDYMLKMFPEIKERDEMRKVVWNILFQNILIFILRRWLEDTESQAKLKQLQSSSCLMVRSAEWCSPGSRTRCRTCCCWTNPPTTWTWRPSMLWLTLSTTLMVEWCWSVTTLDSLIRWIFVSYWLILNNANPWLASTKQYWTLIGWYFTMLISDWLMTRWRRLYGFVRSRLLPSGRETFSSTKNTWNPKLWRRLRRMPKVIF